MTPSPRHFDPGVVLAAPRSTKIARLVAVAMLGASLGLTCRGMSGAVGDCLDATCRITTPGGSCGTGCVFEISQGQVYVLTAGHVVGRAGRVQCEFWHAGHQSVPLAGQTVVCVEAPRGDAAVVAVSESQFGGLLPACIPLAPAGYVVRPGATLLSAGCARGAWSTGWKGHALGYEGEDLHFVPAPAEGRSGSALLDADGRYIVGLIRARTGDDRTGVALSLQSLHRQLRVGSRETGIEGKRGQSPFVRSTLRAVPAKGAKGDSPLFPGSRESPEQATAGCLGGCCPNGTCPGGCCPSGSCPNGMCPDSDRSCWRRPLEPVRPASPWPTLPPPAAPPVDLAPIGQAMGQVADAIGRLQPPPAMAAAPAGPDFATTQALQQLGMSLQRHDAEIGQIRQEVPRAIESALRPISERVAAIDGAIKPLERIKERLDQDVATGGLKGKIAQRIEDAAAGSPPSGDPAMRLILITLAAAGAVGLAVFLVIRQHQGASALSNLVTHAKTAVDGLAVKAPALAPVATGLDAAGNLIQQQLAQIQAKQAQHDQTLGQIAQATSAGASPASPAWHS